MQTYLKGKNGAGGRIQVTTPEKGLTYRRKMTLPLDILLGLMLTGPFLAPLFLATGIEPFYFIGRLIYWLGAHICPQPDLSIPLGDSAVTAVCARCFAAAAGLTVWRILYGRYPAFRAWFGRLPLPLRAGPALIALAIWWVDIAANKEGHWHTGNPLMFLTGLLLGLATGSLVITACLNRAQI